MCAGGAGVLCKREGEEDPGDVCPPLSPKATKTPGDEDFPFLPACAAAPFSIGRKRIPQILLSEQHLPASRPAERSAGCFEMRMWHCPYCEPAGAFLLFFFFPFLFLLNNFPNESSKLWNYFDTLRFHHLFYITLFTASYSIIIMIIPLSDVGISNYIS